MLNKVEPIKISEVLNYACSKNQTNESAANILLLYGPDCFDGTYEEYENLLTVLQR